MHWKNTTGNVYTLNDHTLVKSGKQWTLYTATGLTYPLGSRASFDHAEVLISRDPIVVSVVNAWLFARSYDPKVTLRAAAMFARQRLTTAQISALDMSVEDLQAAAYAQLCCALQVDANMRAHYAKHK